MLDPTGLHTFISNLDLLLPTLASTKCMLSVYNSSINLLYIMHVYRYTATEIVSHCLQESA